MVVEQQDLTLAAFVLEKGKAARTLLDKLQEVDAVDTNVQIVDAAIVDRTKRGRIKIHQTEDKGALKGGVKGGAIGVVVGALVLGPAGAVLGGAAGGVLNSVRNRLHDVGINDKFMKEIGAEIEKGKSALFVQYTGNWEGSVGVVVQAVKDLGAQYFYSTLTPDKVAQLEALINPATEELGGEDAVADYEVEVEEVATVEEVAAAQAEEPAEEPVVEAPVAAAAAVAAATGDDDLTQLAGIGPKGEKALKAAGYTTYAALAEANEPQLRNALYESGMLPPANVGTWPMQASYAAKGDWVGLMKRNQKTSKSAAAKPEAAAAPAKADDLTQISGIGPRLSSILERGGVTTYSQLEQMSPDELREIIALGGALPPSSLASWPAQASYASRGDWSGLASFNRSK